MKCKKCNKNWSPLVGKPVICCPFCSEPIQSSLSSSSFDNVIKNIVQQYGEGILLDSKRLYSMVADKLGSGDPQTLKRIRLAISDETIPKKLLGLKSASKQERMTKISIIANAFKDDHGVEIEAAHEIINYFANSLDYKLAAISTISMQDKPKTKQQSPPDGINPNFPCKVFVFPIGRFNRSNIYENTRKYWKITKKYQNTSEYKYAVGIEGGYSESAYELSKWTPSSDKGNESKHEFEGDEFIELKGFSFREQTKKAGGFFSHGNHLVVEFDGNGKFRLERPNKPEWLDCCNQSGGDSK